MLCGCPKCRGERMRKADYLDKRERIRKMLENSNKDNKPLTIIKANHGQKNKDFAKGDKESSETGSKPPES